MGSLDFEVSSEAEPRLLDDLIRLHELRWQKQGEPGMIAANQSQFFLRAVTEQFAASGMLRIFTVRWRDAVAAIVLTFLYRGKIFSYMSAFDPEHEILGFGRTLLYESFRYCFDQGYTAWNFLRGTESYKSSWGALPIPKIRLYKER
jgi:CelD/BcsL family acetyltransferase involved in cellulose biosynthesis